MEPVEPDISTEDPKAFLYQLNEFLLILLEPAGCCDRTRRSPLFLWSLRLNPAQADGDGKGDEKLSGSRRGSHVKIAIAKIHNTKPGDLASQTAAS